MNLFFSCHFDNFIKFVHDILVIFFLVGHQTVRTVLDAIFCVFEIAAAVFTQSIQRTVAEQAVEVFLVLSLVAREKLALPVLEKFIVFGFQFLHNAPPFSL